MKARAHFPISSRHDVHCHRKTSCIEINPDSGLRLANHRSICAHRLVRVSCLTFACRYERTTRTVCPAPRGVSLLHDVNQPPLVGGGTVFTSMLDVSHPSSRPAVWWSQTGSNRRPPACKAGALPTELWPRLDLAATSPGLRSRKEIPAHRLALVGLERFELSTSRLSSARSNQLSYRPGKRGGRPKRRKRNEDGGVPQRELEAGASQAPCVSKHRERAKPRWLLTSVFLASLERR